jgi:uncharacterized protein YdaU (DUF1376 family)
MELCELARVTPEEWEEIKPLIISQFVKTKDGRLLNTRLQEEANKQALRSKSGSKGGSKTQANRVANRQAKGQAKFNPSSSTSFSSSSSSISLKALSSQKRSAEELKEKLDAVNSQVEEEAVRAMGFILGADVMEGGDLDREGHLRTGDGAKWRGRFRENRPKVHRVFAAVVEEMIAGKVKSPGAVAEERWKEFA